MYMNISHKMTKSKNRKQSAYVIMMTVRIQRHGREREGFHER